MSKRTSISEPPSAAGAHQLRALLVHRYLAPDVPVYGWMLPRIAEAAKVAGYVVELLSVQPSYVSTAKPERQPSREYQNGILIRRISVPLWHIGDFGKSIAGIWFALAAFLRTLVGQFDVVMTATTPPVLLARAVSLAARIRGSKFIYHCQDIHPEIAQGIGPFAWGWTARLFSRLDEQTCRSAHRIVTLSQDMKATIVERRGVAPEKIEVINNFSLGVSLSEATARKAKQLLASSHNHFRIVFSGNIGRFQGLSELLSGASAARAGRPIELIFVGTGVAEPALRRQAKCLNLDVRFLGRQPKDIADAIVAFADLAVVSLRPGLIRFAFPSKTLDYMQLGTPMLAVVESDSELGQVITKCGLGVIATPGEAGTIARAIESSQTVQWRYNEREKIRACSRQFGMEATLRRWQALFESVAK